MKKLLFLTTALFMFMAMGVNAQSQQKGPRQKMTPEQHATITVERLNDELKLTEAQQKELQTWYTEAYKKREENFKKVREGQERNREEINAQMKKDQEATEAQLKKILTEEQFKTYKENQEKRRKEIQQRGPRPQGQSGFPRN